MVGFIVPTPKCCDRHDNCAKHPEDDHPNQLDWDDATLGRLVQDRAVMSGANLGVHNGVVIYGKFRRLPPRQP